MPFKRSVQAIRRGRPLAVAILAAILFLAVIAIWMVIARTSPPAQPPSTQMVTAVEDRTSSAPKSASSASSPLKDRKSDRCDKGQVTWDKGIPTLSPSAYREADTALSSSGATLAAAAEEKDRALGLFLQRLHVSPTDQADAACEDEACRDKAAAEAYQRAARPYTDALVQLASTTSRPDVYALAFHACGRVPGTSAEASCALISAAQWSRIEPNNAVPWFYAADAAAKRGDWSERDEAYFRASKAIGLDTHLEVFGDFMQSDAARSLPPDVQAAIGIDLIGVVAATPTPAFRGLSQSFCSSRAVSEPNRRQVCSDLAELMSERSDSQYDLWAGLKLGERVGWPSERLDALRDQHDALLQLGRMWSEASGCQAFPAFQAMLLKVLRSGEIGFRTRDIASSGRSTQQLAEAWRAALKANAEKTRPDSPSGAGSSQQ